MNTLRLRIEFALLYFLAPVLIAVAVPASAMFTFLFLFTIVGIVLLHRTQGFTWVGLVRHALPMDWRVIVGFTIFAALGCWATIQITAPQAWLLLPRVSPELWLLIMLLYPVFSALPQELVFRPLFFRRYGVLLPARNIAIVLNAMLFSLAHLMYWSWTVAILTFVAGLFFAWAYEVRRDFALAALLHAIAGNMVFTAGLGVYFYSGNVVRPF